MTETQFEKKPFINMAKTQLHEVLDGIKLLSYNTMPPMATWLTNQKLIEEFIEKISETFPFDIYVKKVVKTLPVLLMTRCLQCV